MFGSRGAGDAEEAHFGRAILRNLLPGRTVLGHAAALYALAAFGVRQMP
jgi:hypothetical protein